MASISDPLVKELLDGRYIASLATESTNGSLHMVAVWFLFEGGKVYVATAANSRKARNLQAKPKASIMIDSRDPAASRGVTLCGSAQLLTGDSSKPWNAKIHEKYLSAAARADMRVGPVFAAWDDITIEITPASVVSWDMRVADQQAFGGALGSNPGYLLDLAR
jgi:PPOX class probable F420-dependent enzyme